MGAVQEKIQNTKWIVKKKCHHVKAARDGPPPEDFTPKESVVYQIVVLLHCGLNPFIEISIRNNSSSSDVLNIQVSISISPKFESK